MAVQTAPGADCRLHREGIVDAAKQMRIHADGDGIVTFYANSSAAAPPSIGRALALDCTLEDGSTAPTQLIDPLQATAFATARNSQVLVAGATWRPALTGDPMALTQAELVARGYPPRPEPTKSPEHFAKWQRLVSTPARPVSTKLVSHPELKNDLSPNWTGPVVTTPHAFYEVIGEFTVPAISPLPEQEAGGTYSSLWVGMDGWNSPDVVQAGTEQVFWANWDYGDTYDAATYYYAWVEWYPDSEKAVSIGVHPGDVLWVSVWVGQADGTIDPAGGFGWFFLENTTTHSYYYGNVARPSGTAFAGDSFEGVMERPQKCDWLDGCAYTYLSNFGTAHMDYLAAEATDGIHNLITDLPNDVWMYDGSSLLATTYPYGPVYFYWYNY
jgi:hypothetical protein